ncbi:MAG: CAP domain-containing protein [Pirellulaceae bacterium]
MSRRLLIFTACVSLIFLGSQRANAQSLEEFHKDYLESPAEGPDLSEAEQVILEKTNAFRREHDLPPVEVNDQLTKTAAYFAAFMARTGEYGHTADGNQPSERASLFDYEYCIVSENIAKLRRSAEFTTAELGRGFYEGWLNSPEHRAAMLNPYVTQIGLAIAHDPESDRYYGVQMFGRPRSAAFRFKVINRTAETVSYSLSPPGSTEDQAQTLELPPQAIRTHLQCRPTSIDWAWTEAADDVQVDQEIALVITGEGDNLTVRQQTFEEAMQGIQVSEGD